MVGVSLRTPDKIRRLQRTLYVTAKQALARRFHVLYDKVWREDILAHAYALSRANGGAPDVDGETFADIEAAGRDHWLGALREEVRSGRYTPQPVRRVMIPKASGVGQRPLGIPTIRDRVVHAAAVLILEPIFEAGLRRLGLRVPSEAERARGGAPGLPRNRQRTHRGRGRRPAEVLRHDSALRPDDERRAPHQ